MSKKPDRSHDDIEVYSFTRELGLTHGEFYRSLPPALGARDYTVTENRVHVDEGMRKVTIELGPQRYRSIASLRLPYTEVLFTFEGFAPSERADFMARFERYFQRGGG